MACLGGLVLLVMGSVAFSFWTIGDVETARSIGLSMVAVLLGIKFAEWAVLAGMRGSEPKRFTRGRRLTNEELVERQRLIRGDK